MSDIQVSLLYSPRAREVHEQPMHVPQGTTVLQAIQASGRTRAKGRRNVA